MASQAAKPSEKIRTMKRENFMLTEHFSYNEMTRSAWAERNGVDNTPDALYGA